MVERSSPKRVLFFHIGFPYGGGERVTMDIASYIVRYDYETYVAACKPKAFHADYLTLLPLPDRNDFDSFENAQALVRLIKHYGIDIFVLPGFMLRHLEYIRQHTVCKMVYILHNMPLAESVAKYYQKKYKAQASWVGRLKWAFITYPQAMWLKKYERRCIREYKRVYRLVDAYVVLCEDYKKQLEEILELPEEKNKICAIHNSEQQVERVVLDKKDKILFVGRFNYEQKRIDRLIKIWNLIYKQVPTWELVLVGDGATRKEIEQQVRDLNLERVVFCGRQNDVRRYYEEAAVLCLTSTFEGWPLCLTEAQAHGVIPVAFDCCAGIRAICSPNGHNGVLVPSFDIGLYAESLLLLLKDASRRKAMQQHVLLKSKEYAPQVVGGKWLNLLNTLI